MYTPPERRFESLNTHEIAFSIALFVLLAFLLFVITIPILGRAFYSRRPRPIPSAAQRWPGNAPSPPPPPPRTPQPKPEEIELQDLGGAARERAPARPAAAKVPDKMPAPGQGVARGNPFEDPRYVVREA